MAFGRVCLFPIFLVVSATVFALSDSNQEETTTSCTTTSNVSSEDYTEGTPIANVSSSDNLESNGTAITEAPVTNSTTKRRRRDRPTVPPDPTCVYYVANTTGDQALIGCTVYCENYTKPVEGRQECVNITVDIASTMQSGTPYICPMGFCLAGYCYKTGMKLPCWV
uniref:Evasin n=1 Tax=Amblyomma cajennense TaxID=34607 RepID=A0A023FF35_AMBCJ